jgi:hypothetical protein
MEVELLSLPANPGPDNFLYVLGPLHLPINGKEQLAG